MASGVIKFFNQNRGFGFIVPDEGASDIFVHIKDIRRTTGLTFLLEGQRVSFDTEPGRNGKGPKAVNIKVER